MKQVIAIKIKADIPLKDNSLQSVASKMQAVDELKTKLEELGCTGVEINAAVTRRREAPPPPEPDQLLSEWQEMQLAQEAEAAGLDDV